MWLDGWMRDQSLFIKRFECQVCEQEYPLAEKLAPAAYRRLRCAEEISRDLAEKG